MALAEAQIRLSAGGRPWETAAVATVIAVATRHIVARVASQHLVIATGPRATLRIPRRGPAPRPRYHQLCLRPRRLQHDQKTTQAQRIRWASKQELESQQELWDWL